MSAIHCFRGGIQVTRFDCARFKTILLVGDEEKTSYAVNEIFEYNLNGIMRTTIKYFFLLYFCIVLI